MQGAGRRNWRFSLHTALKRPELTDARPWSRERALGVFVGGLIFVFPSVAVTAPHGATSILGLLLLPALVFGWRGWHRLERGERWVLIGFTTYVASVGLSMLIASVDVSDAFSSYGKYLRFLVFIPIYLMVRRFDLDLSRCLTAGLVVGLFIMCAQVSIQHYALGIEQPGGSRDPVQFAETLMLCTALTVLAVAICFSRGWQYVGGCAAIGAGLFAGYVSLTRNAWLLMPVVLLLLLVYNRARMTKAGWATLGVGVVILGVLAAYPGSALHQDFALGVSNVQAYLHDPDVDGPNSWGIRLNMWRNALIIFSHSPWFGTGLGDYEQAARALVASGVSYSDEPILFEQAHNAYIHTLAESGLFAALAFIAGTVVLPMAAFLRYWSAPAPQDGFVVLGGLTVVLAFALYGIGHTWMGSNNFISVYLVLMLVFLSALPRAAVRG